VPSRGPGLEPWISAFGSLTHLSCVWLTVLCLTHCPVSDPLSCVWSTVLYLIHCPVSDPLSCVWPTGLRQILSLKSRSLSRVLLESRVWFSVLSLTLYSGSHFQSWGRSYVSSLFSVFPCIFFLGLYAWFKVWLSVLILLLCLYSIFCLETDLLP
jgi:hypothetical protein